MRTLTLVLWLTLSMTVSVLADPVGEWNWKGKSDRGSRTGYLCLYENGAVSAEFEEKDVLINAEGKWRKTDSKRFPGGYEIEMTVSYWGQAAKDVTRPGSKLAFLVELSGGKLLFTTVREAPTNRLGKTFVPNDEVEGGIEFQRQNKNRPKAPPTGGNA